MYRANALLIWSDIQNKNGLMQCICIQYALDLYKFSLGRSISYDRPYSLSQWNRDLNESGKWALWLCICMCLFMYVWMHAGREGDSRFEPIQEYAMSSPLGQIDVKLCCLSRLTVYLFSVHMWLECKTVRLTSLP